MLRLIISPLLLLCYLSLVTAITNGSCSIDSVCLNHSSCIALQCQCDVGYASRFPNNTLCDIELATSCQQDHCLICGPYNACYKCTDQKFLEPNIGSCVNSCAQGFLLEKIEYEDDSFGRLVCITANSGSASAPNWVFAVLTVILLLILVFVIIVIIYLFATRYNTLLPSMTHRQRSFELSTVETNTRAGALASSSKQPAMMRGLMKPERGNPPKAPSIPDSTTDTKSIISGTDVTSIQSEESISATNRGFEREYNPANANEVFNEKLNLLRERAPTFLQMLNDMRRRLKELPADHENVPQYKAVMRDVTRLLYLLNKRPENVEIPPDGVKLLTWAERILQRYAAAQEEAKRLAKEKRQPSSEPAKPRVSMILGEQDETKF